MVNVPPVISVIAADIADAIAAIAVGRAKPVPSWGIAAGARLMVRPGSANSNPRCVLAVGEHLDETADGRPSWAGAGLVARAGRVALALRER
jgi:hypothetical protein